MDIEPYCNKEIYFNEINNFFSQYEKHTGLQIIISAHPRANYNKRENPFNGRKIIIGNTVNLVKKSSNADLNIQFNGNDIECLSEAKNLGIAAFVGWIAAEFFIPMLVEQFELGVYTALAIAFFIGYSGIRLLPRLETQIFKRLDKVIGGAGEEKDKGEK